MDKYVEIYETVKIKRDINSLIWQEYTSDHHNREGNFQEFVSMMAEMGVKQYKKNKSSGYSFTSPVCTALIIIPLHPREDLLLRLRPDPQNGPVPREQTRALSRAGAGGAGYDGEGAFAHRRRDLKTTLQRCLRTEFKSAFAVVFLNDGLPCRGPVASEKGAAALDRAGEFCECPLGKLRGIDLKD